MALPRKYNTVVINILLAGVVCLVINFSYLLSLREQERRDSEASERFQQWQREIENLPSFVGTLHLSHDGYGYIIVADSMTITTDTLASEAAFSLAPPHISDSIYVLPRDIERLSLTDGSTLKVITRDARTAEGNPIMMRLLEVNGEPYNYGERFDRPADNVGMILQLVIYFLFAFALLTVMTAGAARNASMKFYLTRAVYCIVVASVAWLLMPVTRPPTGELTITAMALKMGGGFFMVDIMLMKCLFVVAFALLYGRTYQLIYQREDIMLENERLKNENLLARYNTLVGQLNPHFLFNSLNSLSALVREGRGDDAVRYIDRLSDTFRYSIRHDSATTATLGEELEFVDAYKYLLEVRYAEKLFIDIDIEPEKSGWMLPSFSIQPLIENAVKHNTITRSKPLHISVRTRGDRLVVSNPVNPKLEPEKGTGIGLANLSRRWQLLTGHDIEVTDDGKSFTVKLPFIKPSV
jgi:hypothetical protein